MRFDHLNHTHKGPLEQSEVVLNAALACEQLRKLVCTIGAEIDWNIRRIGDFVKQFDSVVIVVRKPVGELLEDRSNQSRTDVIGQI